MKSLVITPNSNHAAVGSLGGFSIAATTAAVVNLREETSGGNIVAVVSVPANDSRFVSFGGDRLKVNGGTYVEVVSGTISGVLWYD